MKRNIAIIPIRMGSKRVPRKNVRKFYGKPIFLYTLEAARNSGLFSDILVSTESEEVRDICRNNGLDLPFMRPVELASDKAQLKEVVAHALEEFERRGRIFDHLCMLWATAPMRNSQDICSAYTLLTENVDAVIGMTHFNRSVYSGMIRSADGYLEPLFPDMLRLPSAKQPEVLVDNGSLCWVRTHAFHKYGTWIPPKIREYLMPAYRSVDIDSEEDWELLEYFYDRFVMKVKKK